MEEYLRAFKFVLEVWEGIMFGNEIRGKSCKCLERLEESHANAWRVLHDWKNMYIQDNVWFFPLIKCFVNVTLPIKQLNF